MGLNIFPLNKNPLMTIMGLNIFPLNKNPLMAIMGLNIFSWNFFMLPLTGPAMGPLCAAGTWTRRSTSSCE